MNRLSVVGFRNAIGDVLNRAQYRGERTVIRRRNRDVAAVIPVADLRLFERLLEEEEDRRDVEAARAALAESDERIPYMEVRTCSS
jgi:prevent-host-death family protein